MKRAAHIDSLPTEKKTAHGRVIFLRLKKHCNQPIGQFGQFHSHFCVKYWAVTYTVQTTSAKFSSFRNMQ